MGRRWASLVVGVLVAGVALTGVETMNHAPVAYAGACASKDCKYEGELPQVVYRVVYSNEESAVNPSNVFPNGFRRRTPDEGRSLSRDLLNHQVGGRDSAYVSTTSSVSVALSIANLRRHTQGWQHVWIYAITPGPDFYNLPQSIGRLASLADAQAQATVEQMELSRRWGAYYNALIDSELRAEHQAEWVSAGNISGERVINGRQYHPGDDRTEPDLASDREPNVVPNPNHRVRAPTASPRLIGDLPSCPPETLPTPWTREAD